MEDVVGCLADHLPEDAVVTNGAGNYAAFLHRYYRFRRHGTQLAPTSGSMGYGFPAAIAACLHDPGRTVVCLAGDGCFQMTLNEMSTAVQHGAAPVVIVANNGRYGTIRMHQEREYPGRVSGTDLANPDFAALARAYGGHGEVVERQEDFAAAFARARAAGTVAVIELRLDPQMLSTAMTVDQMRAAGLARQG
jgi:acetolactate synthase-1/2/3 large subunit